MLITEDPHRNSEAVGSLVNHEPMKLLQAAQLFLNNHCL